jgi:hypothetical protein
MLQKRSQGICFKRDDSVIRIEPVGDKFMILQSHPRLYDSPEIEQYMEKLYDVGYDETK